MHILNFGTLLFCPPSEGSNPFFVELFSDFISHLAWLAFILMFVSATLNHDFSCLCPAQTVNDLIYSS